MTMVWTPFSGLKEIAVLGMQRIGANHSRASQAVRWDVWSVKNGVQGPDKLMTTLL